MVVVVGDCDCGGDGDGGEGSVGGYGGGGGGSFGGCECDICCGSGVRCDGSMVVVVFLMSVDEAAMVLATIVVV